MTGVQNQLRRIDQEITGRRQQIAQLQVEIVRLEDARIVLAALAERDQTGDGVVEPPLLAASLGPLLVVRKARPDGEEGATPEVHSKKTKKMPRRAETAAFDEKIMELFGSQPVLEAGEVITKLHAQTPTKKQKHRVYNALLRLKHQGHLSQTQIGEPYTLPTRVNGPVS
jgi:hypothetical protein